MKKKESDFYAKYANMICESEGLDVRFEPEYRFHPDRRWRADLADPNKKIMIEIEGGVFVYGRHNNAVGYVKDMEKYNVATHLGWRVLRYTPRQFMDGAFIEDVRFILERDSNANTKQMEG